MRKRIFELPVPVPYSTVRYSREYSTLYHNGSTVKNENFHINEHAEDEIFRILKLGTTYVFVKYSTQNCHDHGKLFFILIFCAFAYVAIRDAIFKLLKYVGLLLSTNKNE